MYKNRAEALAPLTDVIKVDQRAFKETLDSRHWTPDQIQAFQAAKTMVAQDVLLTHPDPNEEFVIETLLRTSARKFLHSLFCSKINYHVYTSAMSAARRLLLSKIQSNYL